MSERQYKICPACHTWNEARAIECIACQTDLSMVRAQRRDQAQPQNSQSTQASVHADETTGKICTECGHINPSQARKCMNCRADLSDVIAGRIRTDREEDNPLPEKSYKLVTLENESVCDLTAHMSELVIGREYGLSEYLAGKLYVSRKQASITARDEAFYIKNLSRTNPTFVNNQELKTDEERILSVNDEIGLGGKVINGSRQPQAAYLFVREKE